MTFLVRYCQYIYLR